MHRALTLSLLFLIVTLFSLTFSLAQENDADKLQASLDTWDNLKQKCGGNYRYFVRTSSFTGAGTETEIVVRKNKVVGRRFKVIQGFGGAEPVPLEIGPDGEPPKPEPPKYQWTERFDEVGKNKEGAPPKTLDQLYEEARAVVDRDPAEHERRYVYFHRQGLLKSCYTVDPRIADDAPIKGVTIAEIQLEE